MSAVNMDGWSGAANAIISGNRDEQLMAASELCLLYDEHGGSNRSEMRTVKEGNIVIFGTVHKD